MGLILYGLWSWISPIPSDPPIISTEEYTVYFPRQESDQSYMTADQRGPLYLDSEGCLRLGINSDAPLIIWPKSGITIDIVDDEVALMDETGHTIAHIGDWIMLGGGSIPADSRNLFAHRLPNACIDEDDERYSVSGSPGSIQRIEPDEQLREMMDWP